MDAEEGGGMFGSVADKSAPGWVLAHLAHFTVEAKLFIGPGFKTDFYLLQVFVLNRLFFPMIIMKN